MSMEQIGRLLLDVPATPQWMKPEKPGLVRLPGLFQQYLLNFKGDHLCEPALVLHTDPGGNLPAWAINRELVTTPAKSLKNPQALVKDELD